MADWADSDGIVETWGSARRSLEYAVDLEGPALVTLIQDARREYRATRVRVKTRWVVGQEDVEESVERAVWVDIVGAAWLPGAGLASVTLRDLLVTPDWLESIITRASPRDVG